MLLAWCRRLCSLLRNGGDVWGAECGKVWIWLQGDQRAWHGTRETFLWREKCVYLSCQCMRGWVTWARWALRQASRLDYSATFLPISPLYARTLSWVTCSISVLWLPYTKYHRLGDLNDRYLFLIVLETKKSIIKALADLVLGKSSVPGLQMTTLSLYPHIVFSQWLPVEIPLLFLFLFF